MTAISDATNGCTADRHTGGRDQNKQSGGKT